MGWRSTAFAVEIIPLEIRRPQQIDRRTQRNMSPVTFEIKEEPKDDPQVLEIVLPRPIMLKTDVPTPFMLPADSRTDNVQMPVPIEIKDEPGDDSDDDVIFVSATERKEDSSEDDTDDEDDAETVDELLEAWHLKNELGPILIKHKITLDVLKVTTEDDLKVLIPDDMLAVRILFRDKLIKWQELMENKSVCKEIIESIPSTSTAPNTSSNRKRPTIASSLSLNSDNLMYKSLDYILNCTPKGQQVLNYRFLFPGVRLSKHWRTCLCESIADYCIDNKYILTNTHYSHFTNEIARLFPSESKDLYFTPHVTERGINCPCGYIPDEYNYKCEKLRQTCQPPGYKKRKRTTSPNSLVDNCTKERYEVAKKWLKKRRDPWDDPEAVLCKWKETFRFRRTSFLSTDRKEPVVDQWPVLGHSLGYTLIESDFDQIFADKGQALYDKWDQFCAKVIPIFETDIKDSIGFSLYQNLNGLENKEMRDSICCQLINSLLPPTELIPLKMTTPEGKLKYTEWRPSIMDARNSFFNLAHSLSNAKDIASTMATRHIKLRLIPQPLIFGIGYRLHAIKQFVVIYHNITYTFNSFLKALNVVFKLYHVTNLEYHRESYLMWLFIQKYFFNIIRAYDVKSSELNKLMSRLR